MIVTESEETGDGKGKDVRPGQRWGEKGGVCRQQNDKLHSARVAVCTSLDGRLVAIGWRWLTDRAGRGACMLMAVV